MDANFWGTLIGTAIGTALAAYKAASVIGARLARSTAAQSTVNEIKAELALVKEKVERVEKVTGADKIPVSIDHRAPK